MDIEQSKVQSLEKNKELSVFSVPYGYDAIGVLYSSERELVEFSFDNGDSWHLLSHDIDSTAKTDERFDFSSDLFFLENISYDFQFRYISSSGVPEEPIEFFFLNIERNTEAQNNRQVYASENFSHYDFSEIPKASYPRDNTFFEKYNIIPREFWGANENFRYQSGYVPSTPAKTNPPSEKTIQCQKDQALYPDEFAIQRYQGVENNKKLKWGYRYSPEIKKIFIHHTAENGAYGEKTSREVINGIYSYHANGRGWGDIGYNFIISPTGEIFEGRAGGDFVAGGHVYCSNIQTLGISLMGNFEEKEVNELQVKALQKLLRGLSEKYNIDPSAESLWHGKFSPNVIGHREYGHTACPGEHLNELLPLIRQGVDLSGLMFALKKNGERAAKFLTSIRLKTIDSGEIAHYLLQFKNTGTSTWDSSTWLFADLPSTDVSLLPVDGKGVFFASSLREKSVPPGSIGTFEVDIIAGFQDGLHTIEFSPVIDSRRIKSASVVIPVKVKNSGVSIEVENFTTTVSADKKSLFVSLDVLNTGSSTLVQKEVLFEAQLENTVRFLKMKESLVKKGEVAHFSGSIPIEGAKKVLLLSLSLSNRHGKIDQIEKIQKTVFLFPHFQSIRKIWKGHVQGSVQRKIETFAQNNTLPQKYFSIKNIGNQIWKKGKVFVEARYKREKYALQMLEGEVAPQESATFFLEGKTPLVKKQRFKLEIKYLDEQKRVRKFQAGKFKWYVSPLESGDAGLKNENYSPLEKSSSLENKNENQFNKTDENIRIKLGYTNNFLRISGDFELWKDGEKIKNKKTFFLTQKEESLLGRGLEGKIFRFVPTAESDQILTVSSWERSPSWNKDLNDNMFRGVLEARIYNGKLVLINELPLEDYLKGLAEVSNDAPKEKKKAIAVIARSYAKFYMNAENRKYPNAPYDGDDSPASFQKYLGYGYEKRSPLFSEAVRDTSGKLVVYNGEVVKTPFFSESAGRTLSAQEVWGWTHTPYLLSVADDFCKQGNGTKKGHGVGLSGCGAEEMAKQGKTYREILKYYYTGIEIQ